MSFQPVNPRPFLQARYEFPQGRLDESSTLHFNQLLNRPFLSHPSGVGTEMVIRLKWGQTEYKGILESIDSYMNVLLRDTEEFIDGKNTGTLGLVLIRCNNILWMGSAENVEMTDLGLK
ncbi:LSM domain protein [Penicillium lagena]|uniref:LSM domain protein n=1 Tax=Penicillium lagena TaxID=94218 RepID=UPI002540CC19|nr:LSM domain protein [Penicillium lagena]KAJ5610897.1 LSM domain protein [Penicillium lagena]